MTVENKAAQDAKKKASAAAKAQRQGQQEAIEKRRPVTIKDHIRSMVPAIRMALPANSGEEEARRYGRMLLTALTNNPDLERCTPQSFCGAMMQAAQLGLEPNTPTGEAYLIPYKNRGVTECQLQIGLV